VSQKRSRQVADAFSIPRPSCHCTWFENRQSRRNCTEMSCPTEYPHCERGIAHVKDETMATSSQDEEERLLLSHIKRYPEVMSFVPKHLRTSLDFTRKAVACNPQAAADVDSSLLVDRELAKAACSTCGGSIHGSTRLFSFGSRNGVRWENSENLTCLWLVRPPGRPPEGMPLYTLHGSDWQGRWQTGTLRRD